jgi:hypothetical protein
MIELFFSCAITTLVQQSVDSVWHEKLCAYNEQVLLLANLQEYVF